jgi:hypothetical protein
MNDHHMDGFYCWDKKQQLYEILWYVEKALKDAPNFVVENEWLKEKGKL